MKIFVLFVFLFSYLTEAQVLKPSHKKNDKFLGTFSDHLEQFRAQTYTSPPVSKKQQDANRKEVQAIFNKCAEHLKSEVGEESIFYKSAIALSKSEKDLCDVNALEGTDAGTLEKDLRAILKIGMNQDKDLAKEKKMKEAITKVVKDVNGTIKSSIEMRKKTVGKKIRPDWNKDALKVQEAFLALENSCRTIQKQRKALVKKVDPKNERFENIPLTFPSSTPNYTLKAKARQKQVNAALKKFDEEDIGSDYETKYGAKELVNAALQKIYATPELGDVILSSHFRSEIGLDTEKAAENCLIKGKVLSESVKNITSSLMMEASEEIDETLAEGKAKTEKDLEKIANAHDKVARAAVAAQGVAPIIISKSEQYREIMDQYVRDYPLIALKYVQETKDPTAAAFMCTALIKGMESEEFSKQVDYAILAGNVALLVAAVPFTGGSSLIGLTALAGYSAPLVAAEVGYLSLNRIPEAKIKQMQVRVAGATKIMDLADAVRRDEEMDEMITTDKWSIALGVAGAGLDFFLSDAGKLVLKSMKKASLSQLKAINRIARSQGNVDADKLLKNINVCAKSSNFDECMNGLYKMKKVERSIASQLDNVKNKIKLSDAEIEKFRKKVLAPGGGYDELFIQVRSLKDDNIQEVEKLLLDVITLKALKDGHQKEKILSEVGDAMRRCNLN